MNKEVIALKVNGHPDYAGVWHRRDVLEEMVDILGYVDDNIGNDWINWVLDHMDDIPQDVTDMLAGNDQVISTTIWIDNRRVTIEKIYNK